MKVKDIELLQSTLKSLWKTLMRKEFMKTFSACISDVSRKKIAAFCFLKVSFIFWRWGSSPFYFFKRNVHICALPSIAKSCGIREILLHMGLCPYQNINFHTPTGIQNDLLLYCCMWCITSGVRLLVSISSSFKQYHSSERTGEQTQKNHLQRLSQSVDTKWGGKYGPASVPGKNKTK